MFDAQEQGERPKDEAPDSSKGDQPEAFFKQWVADFAKILVVESFWALAKVDDSSPCVPIVIEFFSFWGKFPSQSGDYIHIHRTFHDLRAGRWQRRWRPTWWMTHPKTWCEIGSRRASSQQSLAAEMLPLNFCFIATFSINLNYIYNILYISISISISIYIYISLCVCAGWWVEDGKNNSISLE